MGETYVTVEQSQLKQLKAIKKLDDFLNGRNHKWSLTKQVYSKRLEGKPFTHLWFIASEKFFKLNPKNMLLHSSIRKRLIASPRDTFYYQNSRYDVQCINTPKGVQLRIIRGFTGPALAFGKIYFSDIASYVLWKHSEAFNFSPLKLHSILLEDVYNDGTERLGYNLRKNIFTGKAPSNNLYVHPKIKTLGIKERVLTYQEALNSFKNERYKTIANVKISEYCKNGTHRLLKAGWGKSIRYLCKELGIAASLANAKISLSYVICNSSQRVNDKDLPITKMKITFRPSVQKREETFSFFQKNGFLK